MEGVLRRGQHGRRLYLTDWNATVTKPGNLSILDFIRSFGPLFQIMHELHYHHHHHHHSLSREGRWDTTDDFTTSFLHFSLLSAALWDLANTRPVHSLVSSHLFFCLPCFPTPFTVLGKMVLARPDGRETCPYHFTFRLFTTVRRSSCGPIACWILARTSSLVTWSFLWYASYLAIAAHFHGLYSSLELCCEGPWFTSIQKKWMWQASASDVPWNWEKYSCHSKLVSTLSMLLLSVLSWGASLA